MRILVVEDERSLARAIVKILEKGYYSADSVGNGADALEYLDCGNYDAVILDVMMPVMDGITALKKIRERGNGIPVLVLTAKSEVDDKVRGLDSGADYYLTKPFDAKELLAAIRAITRPSVGAGARLTLGNLTLDRTTYELSAPGGSFRLTGKEFQVMELLMSDPSRVHRQEKIFGRVWGTRQRFRDQCGLGVHVLSEKEARSARSECYHTPESRRRVCDRGGRSE